MQYSIADPAQADLRSIRAFLKRRGEDAWPTMNRQFRRAFRLIAEAPDIGYMEPEWTDKPVRFFVVYPYIVAYDPRVKPVTVLGVIHGALDVGRVFKNR